MKARIAALFMLLIIVSIPASAQETPFAFIMLTDPQLGMYANNKDFVRETGNYEFAVATVNRLKPGFVIVLGDLINKDGDQEQIREFFRISKKINPSVPVYYVPGNHDVGQEPTPQTLAAYRQNVGRDYYSFRAGPIYGIVLDSAVMIAPQKAQADYDEQISWLKKELETAKGSEARHVIVFQHHPLFVSDPNEADQWGNVPLERRRPILELLHKYGVHYVFAGHVHKNSVAKDGDLEMVACGPVAMPFGEDGSGLRLAIVTSSGIEHRYYNFGKLPDKLEIK
jgi:3',5'-cyclic AMP phosphodiesterase CpdA